MTTLKALETNLYWMQVVYRQSTDPVQRERVKARIAKLETEIANHPDNLEKTHEKV
jgi:cytochrome c-type biogenesis protein CcmH/NrfG